ncbi:hypothetical protein C1Y40_00928 [Mycobacterium talmoniae]|uniref:Uncharacterized protein n=1 Tax=Mycobacterium talmoniae TaxID=1858794 RepID=A0A2S8BQA2_9MYCO|nr:hypothetical protein C1Y40_00928 [Mycobacterium talmoniae]
MDQLAGRDQLPARVVVHRLAGEHHRRPAAQLLGVRANAPAAQRQTRRRAVAAVQHVQLVGFRVAQRPHLGGGAEQHVDRVDRHIGGQPAQGVDQAAGHVAASRPDGGGDQRKHPLGVGVAGHQVGGADLAQPLVEHVESLDHAVVREDPAVLQERVGVDHLVRSGGRVPDVRDERGAGHVVGFGGEVGVLPGRDGLFAQLRLPVAVEHAQAGAVGVAPALFGEAVRGVEQPKRGGHHLGPGVQREQAAHAGQPASCADSSATPGGRSPATASRAPAARGGPASSAGEWSSAS